MALSGKQVIVDLDQLPPFVGTLTQGKFEVVNTIDNKVYQVTLDQLAIPGNPDVFHIDNVTGTSIEIPELEDRKILSVARSFFAAGKVINSTDPDILPVGTQMKWDKVAKILSIDDTYPWDGEELNIIFT